MSSPAPARVIAPHIGAWTRTAAVDLFRGLGLWMVFVDHMDPNVWSYLTLWRFGFSDFAEMFVFLSGFIGIGSYQRALEAGQIGAVVKKLFRRMRRLYVAHILSLALSLIVLGIFAQRGLRVNDGELYIWMQDPVRYALRILALTYAPTAFSLLPLYIAISPILLLATIGLRRAPVLTLSLSGTLWLASQFPAIDSRLSVSAWYLHPAAWQFLFVLGAATRFYSDRLRKFVLSRAVMVTAAAIVAGSLVLKALTIHWIAPRLPAIANLIPALYVGKHQLAFYRLLHFLALAVVVNAWIQWNQPRLESWPARLAMACGWDSLFIYCSILVLGIGANLVLASTHGGVLMQTQLTIYGLALVCGMAWLRRGNSRSDRPAVRLQHAL